MLGNDRYFVLFLMPLETELDEDLTVSIRQEFLHLRRIVRPNNSGLALIEPDNEPNVVVCVDRKRKGHRLKAEEAIRLLEIGEVEIQTSDRLHTLSLSQAYNALLRRRADFVGCYGFNHALRIGLHLQPIEVPSSDAHDWRLVEDKNQIRKTKRRTFLSIMPFSNFLDKMTISAFAD